MQPERTASETFDDFRPTSLRNMNPLHIVFVVFALAAAYVTAESHTVSFSNGSVPVLVGSKRHY